ncbi:hypothetical protein Nepgr_017601 [Nepenthes gracilis]|uniref:Cystatin domain-containing protein n=1 Tax=Nepenthes gracilis TaxID=150966 RepID=A0AAD3SRQ6_NEPGR|nr:hypothetical protein Nepgr_017601 [Nepenthes gracilis]
MESKHFVFFLSVVVLFFAAAEVSAAVDRQRSNELGSYRPIKNLTEPRVIEVGNFAVSEHNKEAGTKLLFVKVVKGDFQVVSGLNFRLVISAKDGVDLGNYEAVVYKKPWQSYKRLISFKKV